MFHACPKGIDTMNLQGVIFDLDGTLTHSFKEPELEGQPLPGIVDLLVELRALNVPMAIATNQAGPAYQYFQPEIIKRSSNNAFSSTWKPKPYPTAQRIADNLAGSMRLLGVADKPIYISVYDRQLEKLLAATDDLPAIAEHTIRKECDRIAQQLYDALKECDIDGYVYSSPHHRKPEPGMLMMAANHWRILPENNGSIIYCGDMHTFPRSSDRIAAERAGMTFVEAEQITTTLDLVRGSVEHGDIGSNTTIFIEQPVVRLHPADDISGVRLDAGTAHRQLVTLINESSHRIDFAPDPDDVNGAPSLTIEPQTSRQLWWDADTDCWRLV
jgi:histidinol phosphatase-like enzyme